MPKLSEIPKEPFSRVEDNSQNRSGYYFAPRKKPKEKTPRRIRMGETVHGHITEKTGPNEAFVLLPSGTFKAELHGKLKKGDSLFFKVTGVDPALVLKVHAVSVKIGGKEVPVREILRMLDLPADNFNISLAAYLRQYKSIIERDFMLLMNKDYSSLPEKFLRDKKFSDVLKALFFLHDSGIRANEKNFTGLFSVFRGAKYLHERLEAFEKVIPDLPTEFSMKFRRIFSLINNDDNDILKTLRFFLPSGLISDENETVYDILEQFLINSEESGAPRKLILAAQKLAEPLEAHNLWNAAAMQRNSPLHFYLPVKFPDGYHVLQLIVRLNVKIPQNKKTIFFSLKNIAEKLADIIQNATQLINNIDRGTFFGDDNPEHFLKQYLSQLNKDLKNENYAVKHLSISRENDADIEIEPESNPMLPRSFHFVI